MPEIVTPEELATAIEETCQRFADDCGEIAATLREEKGGHSPGAAYADALNCWQSLQLQLDAAAVYLGCQLITPQLVCKRGR